MARPKGTKSTPELLLAMRRAASGAPTTDGKKKATLQRRMEEWLQKDPKAFWSRLAALEAAWMAMQTKERKLQAQVQEKGIVSADTPPTEPEPDLGSERVLELIERLLKESQA